MSVVTVVPTVEPSTDPTDPPRIRLDVTDTGTPAISSTTVVRINADGTQVPVRTADGGPLVLTTSGSNRVGLLYDYEAPLGLPATFTTQESPGVVSAAVTLDDPSVWLIHLGVPSLSLPVDLFAESFGEEQWDVTQGIHWPMGRGYPVVQTQGTRRAPSSSVTVAIDSPAELSALRAITADAGVLQLNVPAGLGYGVDTCYIAVGPIRNRRLTTIGASPLRAIDLPYQVVDRPAGGSQAERNYADITADFATYADLAAAYPTYLALLSGP